MHIPKTGGTTFRHLLYDYYDQQNVYPNQNTLKNEYSGRYPSQEIFLKDIQLKNPNIICGHYPSNVTNKIHSNYETITFIRNPLNRFLSHLGHIIREEKYSNIKINEIFSMHWKGVIRIQSKFFGFTDFSPNWKLIDKNINNVSFIGINESFEQSVELFNAIYGSKLTLSNRRENVAQKIIKYNMLSQENQTKLITYLTPEITVYNKCLRRYKSLLKNYNI